MIIGHGMVAFRDPNGIRPLVLGKRDVGDGRTSIWWPDVALALDTLGFEFLRDVAPGEAVYITAEGPALYPSVCRNASGQQPVPVRVRLFCPSDLVDKISVYSARVNMGTKLGERLPASGKIWILTSFIPIPETSATSRWKSPAFSTNLIVRAS